MIWINSGRHAHGCEGAGLARYLRYARPTDDLGHAHLALMAIGQADDDHPVMQQIGEKSVASWPLCCVADKLKAPPTLPFSAPRIRRPPTWSRKAPSARLSGRNEPGCRRFGRPASANLAISPSSVAGRSRWEWRAWRRSRSARWLLRARPASAPA